MKIYFVFCLIIMSFTGKGQTISLKPLLYDLNQANNSILVQSVNCKNYFAKASSYDLQIFNATIGLFENYHYSTENQYKKSNSMSLIYSKAPFLSSNISSSIYPFVGNKDSFNPSGATDFKSALGVGLINLLLNKNSFHIKR